MLQQPLRLSPIGTDYSDFPPIVRTPDHRDLDAGEKGGGENQYIQNSSLGYQTRVGIDWMTNPSHDIAKFGVDHPIPGGIRVNTHIPSSEYVHWTTPLSYQKLSPPQEYHKLLGEPGSNTVNLNLPANRGEPLKIFRPRHRGYTLPLKRYIPRLVRRPYAGSR